jgi:uncharacterized damage-inducible protein DinB
VDAKDAIRMTIDSSDFILKAYIEDLSDADLRLRPLEGMNPIAWQLGHLIAAERHFVEAIQPGASPPLPEGFEQAHGKEALASGDSKGYLGKAEYLAIWSTQRKATFSVLDGLAIDQLERPSGIHFAPTVAAAMNMIGVHPLMHVGQFVAVRRSLGKPVKI